MKQVAGQAASVHSNFRSESPAYRLVVALPGTPLLCGGTLRLFSEPADLGAERGPCGPASLRYDLGPGDQVVESRPRFCSIGFLCPVLAGSDDQHSVSRDAIAC